MKKASADVLNEADAFEAKLRWILFKTENEAALAQHRPDWWDEKRPNEDALYYNLFQPRDTHPEVWEPGVPLYRRPRGGVCGEQTIRPIISELSINYFHVEEVPYYDRCEECEVYWTGDAVCWVCGEERRQGFDFYAGKDGGWEDVGSYYPRMDMVVTRELTHQMQVQTYLTFNEVITSQMRSMRESMARFGASVNELSSSLRYVEFGAHEPIRPEPSIPNALRGSRYDFLVFDEATEPIPNHPIFTTGHNWDVPTPGIELPDDLETEPTMPLPDRIEVDLGQIRHVDRPWYPTSEPEWRRRRPL